MYTRLVTSNKQNDSNAESYDERGRVGMYKSLDCSPRPDFALASPYGILIITFSGNTFLPGTTRIIAESTSMSPGGGTILCFLRLGEVTSYLPSILAGFYFASSLMMKCELSWGAKRGLCDS